MRGKPTDAVRDGGLSRPEAGPLLVRNVRGELVIAAHIVFDRLWKDEKSEGRRMWMRRMAYAWLAERLGLNEMTCHFSVMSHADLERSITLCRQMDAKAIGCWAARRKNRPPG